MQTGGGETETEESKRETDRDSSPQHTSAYSIQHTTYTTQHTHNTAHTNTAYGLIAIQLYSYTILQLYKAIQLYSYTANSYTAIQLYYTAIQLYSYTQLYS
jgi:hypothetical protein